MRSPLHLVRSARAGLAVGLTVTGLVASIAAPSVTAAASEGELVPVPATMLDLQGIALRPSDLPGQGYGVEDGDVFSAPDRTMSAYRTEMSQRDPATDGQTMKRTVGSIVFQYGDDQSAQAALDAERQVLAIPGPQPIPYEPVADAPVVGDDSFTRAFTTPTVDGTAIARGLEINMRAGSFVVAVSITDYVEVPPTVAELAALAEIAVSRAREVAAAGTTGLSHQILRLDLPETWSAVAGSERYVFHSGVNVPSILDSAEAAQAMEAEYLGGRVVDAYRIYRELEGDAGRNVELRAWIYRFADETDAAAYPEYAAERSIAGVGASGTGTRIEVPGAAGPAVGTLEHWPDVAGTMFGGVRVWVQVGATVVSVGVYEYGDVAVEAVRDLANIQAACAQAPTSLCPQVPLPASMLG